MSEEKRKAPAFQFYADDFLAGTMEMSQAEVGAYIRLLCHQWNRGSIPVEAEKQQRLAGGLVSVDVLAKFPADESGLLKNRRMEMERQKQTAYREKQREKGLLSAEARKGFNRSTNRGSTGVPTAAQPEYQPDTQPEGNSPSPSPNKYKEASKWHLALIMGLMVFFIILGCFLDGISMVVLTMGVLMPTVQKAGIDPIWFGIFIVFVVEMAQITPPVGFNLFVLQGMTGKQLPYIARVSMPMFFLMVGAVVLIYFVPGIVTWLPTQMKL